jgi:hypothetical protein
MVLAMRLSTKDFLLHSTILDLVLTVQSQLGLPVAPQKLQTPPTIDERGLQQTQQAALTRAKTIPYERDSIFINQEALSRL